MVKLLVNCNLMTFESGQHIQRFNILILKSLSLSLCIFLAFFELCLHLDFHKMNYFDQIFIQGLHPHTKRGEIGGKQCLEFFTHNGVAASDWKAKRWRLRAVKYKIMFCNKCFVPKFTTVSLLTVRGKKAWVICE